MRAATPLSSSPAIRDSSAGRFLVLGLPARGEPFTHGELSLGLQVWVDARPRFIDRLRIDGAGDARTARWGLAGFESVGTLLAYPATAEMLSAVRAVGVDGMEFAATLVDEVLVCRCLGAQAEVVKRAFVAVWSVLRPMLLDATCGAAAYLGDVN